jgi:hypothetical protein
MQRPHGWYPAAFGGYGIGEEDPVLLVGTLFESDSRSTAVEPAIDAGFRIATKGARLGARVETGRAE